MKISLIFAFLFCLLFTATLSAQTARKDSVTVTESKIIERMKERKEKIPKISSNDLAEFGNALLTKNGFDFSFAAEQGEVLISDVDVDGDDFEIYKFVQIADGKPRLFATRAHGSHPCGTWSGLTVTKLNVSQMTIAADGKFYPVALPKELIFDDIELVEKNLKKPIRRWLTPLDATPEAISKNGKIIYVSTELGEILLGIGADGTLSFVAADDRRLVKQNIELKNYPKDPENDYLGFKKFSAGKQNFFLKFSYPCA